MYVLGKFYEQGGEKKIKWYRAGILKETDKGTRFLRFFHQPETDFFIFENEGTNPKEEDEKCDSIRR